MTLKKYKSFLKLPSTPGISSFSFPFFRKCHLFFLFLRKNCLLFVRCIMSWAIVIDQLNFYYDDHSVKCSSFIFFKVINFIFYSLMYSGITINFILYIEKVLINTVIVCANTNFLVMCTYMCMCTIICNLWILQNGNLVNLSINDQAKVLYELYMLYFLWLIDAISDLKS